MSLTNSDKTIINTNPINNLIGERTRKWTCKHKGITIVDEQNWIYRCHVCWPGGGEIRVIPNTPKLTPKTQGAGLHVYNTGIKNTAAWYGGKENALTTELVLEVPSERVEK